MKGSIGRSKIHKWQLLPGMLQEIQRHTWIILQKKLPTEISGDFPTLTGAISSSIIKQRFHLRVCIVDCYLNESIVLKYLLVKQQLAKRNRLEDGQ